MVKYKIKVHIDFLDGDITFRVYERQFFIFWVWIGWGFDKIEDAEGYINQIADSQVKTKIFNRKIKYNDRSGKTNN